MHATVYREPSGFHVKLERERKPGHVCCVFHADGSSFQDRIGSALDPYHGELTQVVYVAANGEETPGFLEKLGAGVTRMTDAEVLNTRSATRK